MNAVADDDCPADDDAVEHTNDEGCWRNQVVRRFMKADGHGFDVVSFAKKVSIVFQDKMVIDVGSGTGILSMFIIELPFGIEKVNNSFANYLLTSSSRSGWDTASSTSACSNTVLYARDKWLTPEGDVFPDKAKLFIAAIEDRQYKEDKINLVAITEPLVDVVDNNQVVAGNYCVKEIDLYTVQIADLAWTSEFVLRMNRNDYVQALVTYFTVEFSNCHKRTGFSTGPDSQYTHWKQTVFYLQDALTVKKGEELKGVFTCSANARNERDLDFKIMVSFHGEVCDLEEESTYTMH
ncbi:hypothetical protein PRIPAC_97716 [Pristionchus pacificus]|uniref:Protein arginine N-methyltransferase domain-containing protein n=1 Tax=Pristionchus pacificus TaxID=54126 RepID=A0A2A6D369_PRIPA|nr:hypothetical protein PRIPAC_97716 [Pristionchus pacificus]|eukprot:PDM84786.1 hypothetical protein PRIPAC_33809 [Pristionchus pacificus]